MAKNKKVDPSKITLDTASKEPDELTIQEANNLEKREKPTDITRNMLGVMGGGLLGVAVAPTIGALLIGGALGLALVKVVIDKEEGKE